MFFPYYYFDPTMIIVLPALLLAMYAQFRVQSTYRKYTRVPSRAGWTAEQMAADLLERNGIHHVRVEPIHGELTDHYDPREGVLRLSQGVYGHTSLAALGIAAHEVGHAIQHHEEYAPLRIRSAFVPVAQVGSTMAIPLFILGMVLSWEPLMLVGIIAFTLSVLFYIVTLPVEFNASRRAIAALDSVGYLAADEVAGAQKVLNAAALTYVASALSAMLQLLRLLILSGAGRRRD